MARHSAGWTLRRPEGRTVWLVRFQYEGRTLERSTGCRDYGEASKKAAEIYASVTLGVVVASPELGGYRDFEGLLGQWLADYTRTHTAGTAKNVEGYAQTFLTFFGQSSHLSAPKFAEYMRVRISRVSRSTLRKELSALRGFVGWLKSERGLSLPPVPGLPKRGHPGARAHNARRRQATILTPSEVAKLLRVMPERGPRSGAWVRPFFELMWETGLRPYATLASLETPLHYRKGSRTLFVAREIDKARYERTIPLTPEARRALDTVVTGCIEGTGRLFPHVDKDAMRESLRAAAAKARLTRPLSVYDFRHSRITYLANSGAPLAGVAFLVGHKHVSTTALYVRASEDAARAALFLGRKLGRSAQKGRKIPVETPAASRT